MNEIAHERPPNQLPRPAKELKLLEAAWQPPRGWRILSAVNNNIVGYFYLATAFVFFLLAGLLALLMRVQLAAPENSFLSQATYNQFFTMHGTVMMFLFAVPAVEAAGIMLLPQMLGARDLPFPRLGAYAFWAYAIGGTVFFCTLFFGAAPSGGWFMYPPLTSAKFSPDIGADFWLLGIGFIEISAIAGAIEIIVGVMRTRAPGMTLARMPVFAWTMLIFAWMIVFAFPAVILATILLELERAFGWPFFDPTRGGDPLLWQHLFWFFGHPEVYIIFLPAAGMVSMIVPTMAQTPLVAYRLVVIALLAVGIISFGLWVHHMFVTGIGALPLAVFSALSMSIGVPTAVQMFAWVATLARGKVRFTAATMFVLGFLFIFAIGGLTGIMVAAVPFNRQAHDSYFVVAHLHYVLFGGMVFPLFAAIYYWMPAFSRRALSERLGKIAFWFIFAGFNIAFLPMHYTGLLGMPRRVYTYSSDAGWSTLNLLSTCGAFIMAAGILIFLIDVFRNARPTVGNSAGNVWSGGTLEWLPNDTYGLRSVPAVSSRDPLWHRANLPHEVSTGQWYFPGSATGGRETIVTSAIDAQPEYVMRVTGPGWAHVLAALFTAAFFLLLTAKLVVIATLCGIAAVVALLVWLWQVDPPSAGMVDIGSLRLPTYVSGTASHSWWAMIVLILVAAALYFAHVFSFLYIWSRTPDWPAPLHGHYRLGLISAFLAVSSLLLLHLVRKLVEIHRPRTGAALLLMSLVALLSAVSIDGLSLWASGLNPSKSAPAALFHVNTILQAQITGALSVMSVFVAARIYLGMVHKRRINMLNNLSLLWYYAVAQFFAGMALNYGLPAIAG